MREKIRETFEESVYGLMLTEGHPFNPMQVQVIFHLLKGLRCSEIADITGYTEGTVSNSRELISDKIYNVTGFRPRSFAAAIGVMLEKGLLKQISIDGVEE